MGKLAKIGLYWRTIRHLKPIQITNRVKRKLLPIKVDISPAPRMRPRDKGTFHYIKRPKSLLNSNEFHFLNRTETLAFPADWNSPSLPKLWLFNLHYFEGLLSGDTPTPLKHHLIEKWIVENPPAKGNGWEPYPNSMRITNWIKWTLSGNRLSPDAVQSLAVQARYLMKTLEYHLLGNHLFANAKALVFAGVFFAGREADKWLEKGLLILKKQVPEQFLDDGAHFELSTTYHALLCEDLFDIIQIMQHARKDIPNVWIVTAQKALEWLHLMTRPDGFPPLFNDAAYGITPSLWEMSLYGKKIGLKPPPPLQDGMHDLPTSGYFRFEGDDYSFFGDAGAIGPDYIPGHAHCDMLSFELFAHDQPVIVDTGTSTYEIGVRRHLERSTAAHNTVHVGEREQSEIWGGFRVGRRAHMMNRHIDKHSAELAMKGPWYTHRRDIFFRDTEITLKDTVSGRRRDEICIARFHFHPDITVKLQDNNISSGPISLKIKGAKKITINDYSYAPEFNKLVSAKVIEITFDSRLETQIIL